MAARITKSRDPILAALNSDYMAALDAMRYTFTDEGIERVEKARKALQDREATFLPKRVRKARRKDCHTILKLLCKGPFSLVPKYMEHHARELRMSSDYRSMLKNGMVAPELSDEFKTEARNSIWWAGMNRRTAAERGRRLP